jgi:ribosomal protein S8
MENSKNVEKELNELKNGKLIQNFEIKLKENGLIEKINLITLEGENIEITLNEVYCYVVSKNKKVYESFESLLNDLSPKYTEVFWENIVSGLKQNEDED